VAVGGSLPGLLGASAGQVFYVSPSGSDANPGTLAAPWASLGKAFASLQAGQRALVRAGTYGAGQSGSLSWTGAGTQAAPITVAAYPGEHPVLAQLVKLSGSYLRLSGLTIVRNSYPTDVRFGQGGANPGGSVNLWASGCSNCQIDHTEIRGATESGLFISGSPNIRVVNNWIHDNGTTHDDHGIYFCNGSDGLIANNLISHNYDFGIQLYCGSSYPLRTIITDNTIVANGTPGSGGSGIVAEVDNGQIYNNIIANNQEFGIRGWSPGTATIANNLLYGNPQGAYYQLTSSYTLTNNLQTDPQFQNPSTGNYHLQNTSPANKLANASFTALTDYDDVPRPQPLGPSAGAFEYH
jgi:Right handed beta helix region